MNCNHCWEPMADGGQSGFYCTTPRCPNGWGGGKDPHTLPAPARTPLEQARDTERRARLAVLDRINKGIAPMEPKIPVLRLIGDYARAVECRRELEILEAVQRLCRQ